MSFFVRLRMYSLIDLCNPCRQASFRLELFVYVQKADSGPTVHRATETRMQAATARINQHLVETGTQERYGPASLGYWAQSQARLPDDAPLNPPINTTMSQLQHIDVMQRGIDEEKQGEMREVEADYVYIRMSVKDLRRALGLPSFPLYAPYREGVSSQPPAENVEDVDHQDTQL